MTSFIKRFIRDNPRLHRFAVLRHAFREQRARVLETGCYTPRTFHILSDKKLIYMSNSKVACSSIKASMYLLDEQEDYRHVHKAANSMGMYEVNMPYDKYPDYFKFTFVRNPFARLVSCYVNKLQEDKELLGKTMKRLYFDQYLFGYLNKDKGFHDWAKRVCRIPDRYADRHFVSQSYLLRDKDGHMLVDHVYKFENLKDEYEPIREKYGLAPLPHYNKTKKGNWMDYYDVKTAKAVYRRYRRDIEEFGYGESYREILKHIAGMSK